MTTAEEQVRAITDRRAGLSVVEYIRALALNRDGIRDDAILLESFKGSVGAVTTQDPDYSTLAGLRGLPELRTYLERQLLPARLDGAWRVPFNVPSPVQSGDPAAAYWVSQTGMKPVTRFAATKVQPEPRKVAAVTVLSKDRLRETSDAAITRLLTSSVAARVNATFLSDDVAVSGESPAGIAVGAVSVPSTGTTAANVQTDLSAVVEAADAADVDLAQATWLLSPARAALIAATLGLQNLGLRGGQLLGAPAVTDRAAGTEVFLVAADRVAVSIGNVDVRVAEHAAVLMADTPDDGPGQLVSMFQTNSVAYLTEIFINWTILPGAVFVLSSAAS